MTDVEASSRWYQRLLGCQSAHGGADYERLVANGALILQLHRFELEHHHGPIGDPDDKPYGNGVLLWFETDDIDTAIARAEAMEAVIVKPRHRNPPAGAGGPNHWEIWLRDPDGYTVVLASPDGSPGQVVRATSGALPYLFVDDYLYSLREMRRRNGSAYPQPQLLAVLLPRKGGSILVIREGESVAQWRALRVEGTLAKPKGPRRVDGKLDYPDMLDWAWAKAIPATLEALVGDVSAVSVRVAPGLFGILLTIWLTISDDSALKPVLGFATLVTLFWAGIALLVRARRSQLRPSTAIAWHSAVLVGVALVTALVISSALYQDWVRSSARLQAANKVRQDDEAARAAAAQVKQLAQKAQEAAADAAAAKDEAARQAGQAVARIEEAKCLQARDDAIQKATKAQSSARKAVDDCKTQWDEQLIPFKAVREYCKPALNRLADARSQLAEATSKSCGADSTGSIDKAK